jgi:hypothetical protein
MIRDKLFGTLLKSKLIRRITKSFYTTFLKFTEIYSYYEDRTKILQITRKYFKDLVVKNGPFAGLTYNSEEAVGSAFLPKLLGSYESELHSLFYEIINTTYDKIIDVGCAEGYYAVGLALKSPTSQVYAYDTSPKAQRLCRKMAEFNLVQNNIHINGAISSEDLKHIDFGNKSLIICDCEGFEKELFIKDNVSHLKNCDVLIETHDMFDCTITEYLIELFSETHTLKYNIGSTDDLYKLKNYRYIELETMTLVEKKMVLYENRSNTQYWLFFKRLIS